MKARCRATHAAGRFLPLVTWPRKYLLPRVSGDFPQPHRHGCGMDFGVVSIADSSEVDGSATNRPTRNHSNYVAIKRAPGAKPYSQEKEKGRQNKDYYDRTANTVGHHRGTWRILTSHYRPERDS